MTEADARNPADVDTTPSGTPAMASSGPATGGNTKKRNSRPKTGTTAARAAERAGEGSSRTRSAQPDAAGSVPSGRPADPKSRPAKKGTGRVTRPTVDVVGVLRLHVRGFGFVTPQDGSDDCFCPAGTLNGLLDGDVVTATAWTSGDRRQASRVTLLSRSRTQLFGTVAGTALLLDPGVGVGTVPLGSGPVQVRDGDTVTATLVDGQAVPLTVFDAPFSPQAVQARVFARHEIPFDLPHMDDHTVTMARMRAGQRRRDLRDMVTLTIDDASTRDLDDALSVLPAQADGTMRVLVHIADVAEHVPTGSRLDEAARAAATSVYLPGFVRPMLPAELSEDLLSLRPGVDRDVLTVELRLDDVGEVCAVDVYEARIRSNGRLDYPLAGRLLRNETIEHVDADINETLRWLRTAAARLGCQRSRRGGLSARAVDPVLRGEDRSAGTARDLIERLMVAANEAVATWLADRGCPALFRVHDEPDSDAVAEMTAFCERLGFHAGFGPRLTPLSLAALDNQFAGAPERVMALWNALVQRLGKARYEPSPGGHFWLGTSNYCHFTSPIRRYADLAVHRVVKAYLNGERGDMLDRVAGQPFDVLAGHVTARSHAAAAAERDARKILAALAALDAKKSSATVAAEVVGFDSRGASVWLDGVHIAATMPFTSGTWRHDGTVASNGSHTLRLGRSVPVTISHVDVVAGVVHVDFAGPTPPVRRRRP